MTAATVEKIAAQAGGDIENLMARDADKLSEAYKKARLEWINAGGNGLFKYKLGASVLITDIGEGLKIECEISGTAKWKIQSEPVVVDDLQMRLAGVDVKNEEVEK